MVRVESVLDTWRAVRADAAAAVREWPEAERDFRATAELMTFAEMALHIAEAGHILTGILLSGETDYRRDGFRAEMKKHGSGLEAGVPLAELATALERLAEERVRELSGRGAEWWSGKVQKCSGEEMTRLEFMQFVKEHELTHRSQMFVYMRLKGMVPPTTKRRMAAK